MRYNTGMKINLKNYSRLHFSHNIRSLYFSTILRQIGAGLISLFGVIFFFEKFGNSLENVIKLFIIVFLLYGFLVPLSARLIGRIGMKKMMIVGMPFLTLTILSLFFWDANPILFLSLYLVFVTLFRILFWLPYHVDFAEFTETGKRGKQMAVLINISQVVLGITPLIGGFIISSYGFSTLFFIAAVIVTTAIIPLFFIEDVKEKFSFGYLETFRNLFRKNNRSLLVAHASNGIQGAIGVIIWPIFIFAILKGDFFVVGVISSLTIFFILILRTFVGSLIDRWGKKRILKIGSLLSVTGWILKIFVNSGFQIFLADTYHNFGRVVNTLPFDVSFYDQAAENKHYIDEYTVIRTIALNFGRVVVLLISLPIIMYFGITATFIIAAIATLFMNAISRKNAPITK
ncbi:hypothetical protein COB64_04485 [Candidatus Wolfebacteria bacterium]|nr:MAG: hypothetical protein COB64_04485 [Candidatus Wolfebacteria bacterium]